MSQVATLQEVFSQLYSRSYRSDASLFHFFPNKLQKSSGTRGASEVEFVGKLCAAAASVRYQVYIYIYICELLQVTFLVHPCTSAGDGCLHIYVHAEPKNHWKTLLTMLLLEMRVQLGCLLLALVACSSLLAAAQQPTSPGTLTQGQVFTGQYDDFTTFGDNIIVKIATSDGTILRFNGIGLHFYYTRWYRALPRSFEGGSPWQLAFATLSDSSAQHPSFITSPVMGS